MKIKFFTIKYIFMFNKLTFILPVLLFAGAVNAQVAKNGQFRLNPQEIKALKGSGGPNAPGSSNYSAVTEIVLMGNPAKPGIYTILLKVAPNTKIAAHLHPDQRVATVLSGTWHFGYGDKFDETKFKTLPAGSVYAEVVGQNHFAMTGTNFPYPNKFPIFAPM